MPAIILPSKITRPPEWVPKININNQFGARLKAGFLASIHGRVLGNNYPATYDTGVTRPVGKYGVSLRGTTTADGAKIASGGISSILPAASHLTCSMLVRINTTGSRRILIGDYDSAGSNGAFSIEQTAASKWRMLVVNTSPISIEFTSSASVTTGWHFVDLVQTSSRLDGYVDGVNVGSQTMTNVRRAGVDMRIGRSGAFPSLGFDGDVVYCYFFDKAYSNEELALLRRDYLQIIAPVQRKIWIAVPAAPSGFSPYWAANSNQLLGVGTYA